MFLITARAVVNASVWEMKSDLPGRLRSEPNHTAHDTHGVENICGLRTSFKDFKNGII